MNKRKGIFKYRAGNAMLFGVTKLSEGVQFAVYLPNCKKCCLKLYRCGRKTPASVVELTDKYKIGSVYLVTVCKADDCEDSRRIEEILSQDYEYTYEADGVEFVDPYADYVTGREVWCRRDRGARGERGGICIHDFSWGEDAPLRIPYSDLILYQLHVRGYTKDGSSKVQHKGTFRGLIEKLPYLKDLGINGVLLLPVYEFSEIKEQEITPFSATRTRARNRQEEVPEEAFLPDEDIHSGVAVGLEDAEATADIAVTADKPKRGRKPRNPANSGKNQLEGSKNSSQNQSGSSQDSGKAKNQSGSSRNSGKAKNQPQTAAYTGTAGLRRQKETSSVDASTNQAPEEKNIQVNYWGYGSDQVFYFAPKAAYTSKGASPSIEFKELVKAYHEAGIEVLLDIYFTPGTNLFLMIDCLRSWVLKYHVDGFRVNQDVMPSLSSASDPILSGVKILGTYWDGAMLQNAGITGKKNKLGEYNEGFMNDARRFLKSDEGMVGKIAEMFRRNSSDHSYVNFMTHVNGFTMMDLVSYDIKHNEANGELNQDGTEFNYSWNCGVEGKTRKRMVSERRMVQIRNAFVMLLTSQGTPMILAGDEFGNTQLGNNNPYCQDNSVTWLQWNKTQQSEMIFSFVKNLIAFRKTFSVLHQAKPLAMMDTLSCGMPDLSIHGMQAWRPDYSNYSRMLAMLYYGAYVEDGEGRSVYIIYNMFWEPRSFDLPHLPDRRNWKVMIDTYDNIFDESLLKRGRRKKRKRKNARQELLQKKTVVPPRSVVVFVEE